VSDAPLKGLIVSSSEHSMMKFAAVRSGSHLPVAYRLVTKDDGNGNTVPVLQGYYHWREGSQSGGEWRDLATQDWLHADDRIPHSSLS
jgi:hypothetical protein